MLALFALSSQFKVQQVLHSEMLLCTSFNRNCHAFDWMTLVLLSCLSSLSVFCPQHCCCSWLAGWGLFHHLTYYVFKWQSFQEEQKKWQQHYSSFTITHVTFQGNFRVEWNNKWPSWLFLHCMFAFFGHNLPFLLSNIYIRYIKPYIQYTQKHIEKDIDAKLKLFCMFV